MKLEHIRSSMPINNNMLWDIKELHDALNELHLQHKCGCNHPSCNRCMDDKQNLELLSRIHDKYHEADAWEENNE